MTLSEKIAELRDLHRKYELSAAWVECLLDAMEVADAALEEFANAHLDAEYGMVTTDQDVAKEARAEIAKILGVE